MKIQNLYRSQSSRGFSLVEIMIVLVIIGGLMALVLPRIQSSQRNSEVRTTRMKLNDISTKISEYYAECGKYPSSLNFITDDDSSCRNWTGDPKLKQMLKDTWGTDFQYEVSGNGYLLMSLGRDKKQGGSSFDKDIYADESVGGDE